MIIIIDAALIKFSNKTNIRDVDQCRHDMSKLYTYELGV